MLALAVVYIVLLKYTSYLLWCWFGLRFLAGPNSKSSIGRAGLYALLRIGLGFGLGWAMVLSLTFAPHAQNRLGVSPLALIVGFVCLRWLEWSFVGALIGGHAKSLKALIVGRNLKEHLWRLGGLAVSFATNVGGLLGVGALGEMPC